jgi:Flp pilus assembly protein protease CpaA
MSREIVITFCTVISITDIKTRRIPDFLLVIWGIFMVFEDFYLLNTQIWEKLACGSLFFLIFYLIYRITGTMGFGDVKFAGLLGYALNFDKVAIFCLFSALLCLVVFVTGVWYYHWDRSVKLPFAPFLSAGAIAAVTLW